MVPVAASASAPNALSTGELPDTPVEFDGIAMFLVPSLQQFMEAFKDPYYIDIIEPDERMMIDKAGPGSGLIASFRGKMLEMESKADVSKGDEYRKKFEEYEKKAKTES